MQSQIIRFKSEINQDTGYSTFVERNTNDAEYIFCRNTTIAASYRQENKLSNDTKHEIVFT